ncbi:MAG: PEP-CTERM sorting domain-containing protein [Coraliomargaritaceae bacterium]
MKLYLLPISLLFAFNLHAVNMVMDFDGVANGTNMNAYAGNDGNDLSGNWNFGGASIQKRGQNSGHLNIGYTDYFKGTFSGQINTQDVYRSFNFVGDALNTGDYTFTLVFDTWQLQNTANVGLNPGQGLAFTLGDGSTNGARIGLKSGYTNNGFAQAYSQGSGSVSGDWTGSTNAGSGNNIGLNNSYYTTSSDVNDSKDMTLEITGNLDSGTWSSRIGLGVNTNNNGSTDSADPAIVWADLASGSGLTSLSGIQLAASVGTAVDGSTSAGWGVNEAGGTKGNWITVDHMSLVGSASAVPEPSTYALLVGFAAFLFIAIRKRK